MHEPTPLRVSHFHEWGHVNDSLLDCLFAEFAAHGARALSTAPVWSARLLRDPAFADLLARTLDAHGLAMADAHAPWGEAWDLDIEDPARRPRMIAGHRLCMAMLADLGVETYTMHIGAGANYTNGGVHTDAMQACALRTIEALLPEAEAHGLVIAIENTVAPSTTPAVVASLVGSFNSPHLACCLDTGHAHVMDADAPRTIAQLQPYVREGAWNHHVVLTPFAEAVRLLAPWIVTCHVHDNDATGDEHRLPGEGKIDWKRYLAALATCPRLRSIQNEWHPIGYGYPISQACRCFDRLAADLQAERLVAFHRSEGRSAQRPTPSVQRST